MTARSEATAPALGHNNPPEATLAELLADKHGAAIGAVDVIAKYADAAPKTIEDDDGLAKLAEIVTQAGRAEKELDKLRETEKAPFLKAGREVDAFFKAPIDRLVRIKRALTERATVYQRAKAAEARRKQLEEEEAARREAEELRRQAEEAARQGRVDDALADLDEAAEAERAAHRAAEAAPSTADATRLHTASGTTVGTRTTWDFEVVDFEKIPLDALRPYLDRASVEKAIRALLRVKKGDAKLEGVRFFENEQAAFRG